mgnify:CR=1 FL=1
MEQTPSEMDLVKFTPEVVQALRELALALREELAPILKAADAAKEKGARDDRRN